LGEESALAGPMERDALAGHVDIDADAGSADPTDEATVPLVSLDGMEVEVTVSDEEGVVQEEGVAEDNEPARHLEEWRAQAESLSPGKEQDLALQIITDVYRTSISECQRLFAEERMQKMFTRIAYVWSRENETVDYFQGFCDLMIPMTIVFMSSRIGFSWEDPESIERVRTVESNVWTNLEADLFWCMSRFITLERFIYSEPALREGEFVQHLECLTAMADEPLRAHLAATGIDFLFFAYRWYVCLLHRELPVRHVFRLWDVHLALAESTPRFHSHVCAAFLSLLEPKLKVVPEFEGCLKLLHNPPVAEWGKGDVRALVQRAVASVRRETEYFANLSVLLYLYMTFLAAMVRTLLTMAVLFHWYGRTKTGLLNRGKPS